MTKQKPNNILKIVCLLLFALLLTNCSAERPMQPNEYYGLLLKTKELIIFCSFLINSKENPVKVRIFPSIYYAYYTLARTVHVSKTNLFEKIKHDVVWSQNKVEVRKVYGEQLKHIRTHYDYSPLASSDSNIVIKDNMKIIAENHKTFCILIDDVKHRAIKFYKHEPDNTMLVKCETLIDEIEVEHKKMLDDLNRHLLDEV